uniref:GNAT family N-acetyltransferase n=1 Tax=Steinernema glaseri TaxID=37863 RepID=A0A1I7YBG2_9BILA
MAAAVRELFEAGAPQLGQQARRHAEQHYAWDTVVGGLLEHYRAVLGHHEQPVLERRLSRGDELALHGYYHADDGPPPRSPREYFMRRIYTWEGEFYALGQAQALHRLNAGIELFQACDWPLTGFVAPAWLMSEGTRQALRETPLHYTSDPQHLFRLPDFSRIDAPGLVWSARSAWRRGLSKVLSEARRARLKQAATIRLGLHPVDMRHAYSRRYWLDTP